MRTQLRFAVLFAAVSTPLFTVAAQTAASPVAGATASLAVGPSAPAPTKLLYKPPTDAGNIPTRVSSGARGENADASLFALVPDHVALTTQAQPSLFWFQSKAAKAKLELTVVKPKKAQPLLSLAAPEADKPGIHCLNLTKYKVELQPDVLYEWSVAIVPDAENRSKDLIAKGVIKRIKAPDDLAKRVENMDETERAAIYAENGIWYDALEAITNAIDTHLDNASLREQRASLLRQVGLPEAAAADKKK